MLEKYKELERYPDVLSIKDVARYVHVSKDTIRNECLKGNLKHLRIGRLYKITKENLIDFLENNE